MSDRCDRANCRANVGGAIDRGVFVRSFLTAIATGMAGVAPAARASIDYLPMKQPLLIPASAVAVPWTVFNFKAFFTRADGRDGYVPGMALRTSDAGDFAVVCRHCPHMMCLCNLADDHQIVCPCHHSVFDPATDGKRISGPARRDLYKFAFDVTVDGLSVTGIDAGIGERLP